MAKKKDNSIKGALTLGTKRTLPKKLNKDISKVEKATSEIHNESLIEKKEPTQKEEVKKTSLHIPIDLYKNLKRQAFDRGVTLRKLIIETLNEKFK